MHFRYRRVRVGKHTHDRAGFRDRGSRRGAHFSGVGVQRGSFLRHTLLQQQFRRPYEGGRHESALHRPIEQDMRKGQQAHALMMRHECAHDGVILSTGYARGRVIHRLVEPVEAAEPIGSHGL